MYNSHLLVPEVLYWNNEYPLPFYSLSTFLGATDSTFPHTAIDFEYPNHNDGGSIPIHPSGSLIDTKLVHGDCRITSLDPEQHTGHRYYKDFKLISSSLSNINGCNLCVLFLGDSLVDWSGNATYFKQLCEQFGAKVELLGSISNREYTNTMPTAPGEGRSGKRFTDYTGERSEILHPIPPEDYEAFYLNGSAEYRRKHNPFARPARPNDTAADCFPSSSDGRLWTFDFEFYMDRNAYKSPPHHIFINLGTNDIGNGPAPNGIARASHAADRILRSIRDYSPTIHVSFILNGLPIGGVSERKSDRERWNDRYYPFICEMLYFQKVRHDDKYLHIVPGHLIFNPISPWGLLNNNFDRRTGIFGAQLSENGYIHFRSANSRTLAKYQASIVAAYPPDETFPNDNKQPTSS